MLREFLSKAFTQDRFAAAFVKRLRRVSQLSDVSYESPGFLVRYKFRGEERVAHLHNAYVDARKQVPFGVNAVIDGYIKGLKPDERDLESLEFAQSHLLPMVRDSAYFGISNLFLRRQYPGQSPAYIPRRILTPGIEVAIALDSEHTVSTVSEERLQKWGLSFDDALKIAIGNLRERTELKFQKTGQVFISGWNDVYDASRLLLTDMLFRLPLRGAPVVAIPSRNDLLVTGAGDLDGINQLASLATICLESDTRPMCPALLRLEGDSWIPIEDELPRTSPFWKARLTRQKLDYDQQRQLLDELHEKDGTDIFVATLGVYEEPESKGLFTQTQLTKGVKTLLPTADRLVLFDMDTRELLIVCWSDAITVFGEHLQSADFGPALHFVESFPQGNDWAELRARALVDRLVPP